MVSGLVSKYLYLGCKPLFDIMDNSVFSAMKLGVWATLCLKITSNSNVPCLSREYYNLFFFFCLEKLCYDWNKTTKTVK